MSVCALPLDSGWTWHLDVLGSGSEEDTLLYVRYFASEQSGFSLPDLPAAPDDPQKKRA